MLGIWPGSGTQCLDLAQQHQLLQPYRLCRQMLAQHSFDKQAPLLDVNESMHMPCLVMCKRRVGSTAGGFQ